MHVVRDRLAHRIAGRDGARIVHPAPHPSVVAVRARLRDAGIRAVRLSSRREGERLCVPKMTAKNGRSRPIEAGVPGRIFGVRRRVDERQPVGIMTGGARPCGRVRAANGRGAAPGR